MTPALAAREPHPVDLFAVASAGDGWGDDADLDLIGSCCAVEEAARAREWEGLEAVLPFVDDDRIVAPTCAAARLALARAIDLIGWSRAAPAPEGATLGTPEGGWR